MTRDEDDANKRATALTRFRRLLIALVAVGLAMVTAALIYLGQWGAMSGTLVVTVIFGVFISIVLGGGLMAAGFYSSDSGIDEAAAGVESRTEDERTKD